MMGHANDPIKFDANQNVAYPVSNPISSRGGIRGMRGALAKYADQVGLTAQGAVPHTGGKAEVVCYADI
jgi:hypothetical protein